MRKPTVTPQRPPALKRRASGLLALEQRFMFDGAAAADAVDLALDAQPAPQAPAEPAPLLQLPAGQLPAALLAASEQSQRTVADFLQRPEALAQLFVLFNGGQGEPSQAWQDAARQLIADAQEGTLSVRVEQRSGEALQGALGAFAAQGPDGQPTLYLNADFAAQASAPALQAVLLEEIGHAIDQRLNRGADSAGDEGHAFASLLLHGAANAVAAGTESDQRTLMLDGQAVAVELSNPYNIAQTHYVPLPEPDVQTALKAIAGATRVSGDIETVLAVTATSNGTTVVYDHWEDGYEANINNPLQGSTQVWTYNGNQWFVDTNRDGDQDTGEPNVSGAGITVNGPSLILRNAVNPTSPATTDFDGRDKIGSTKAISVTKAGWSATPGTVLAGAVAVIDAGNAGKVYTLPVGQNVQTVATGTNKLFEYTSAHIIATQDGTTVSIDLDGNAATTGDVTTVTLNEGQTYLVNGGLNAGSKITANKGVGVYLMAGDVGSSYENRWFALTPDEQWASSYYAPVGTTLAADPAHVILYNPGASAITVSYDTATQRGQTISVAANSTSYVPMTASAAHFYTTSGAKFFAVSVIDADATDNQTHDWSYSLVPESYLTDKFVVAWGPGNNSSPTTGAANGSPVWVTTTADTELHVDSATVTVRDSKGATVSGVQVGSTSTYKYSVKALESYRLFDSDNDQSGLTVYTTDGTLITGAWGEDPSIAGAGNPFLDMGTTVLPFPDYVFTKNSSEAKTATYGVGVSDNDNLVELGEQIEYTLSLTNRAVIDLFNINIRDQITPAGGATYVAGSTRMTITRADGTVLVNNVFVPDETDGTPFPLLRTGSTGGYTITDVDPGTAGVVDGLKRGDQIVITYRVQVGADQASINALAANGFAVTNDADMSGNGASTPIKFTENKTVITMAGTADGQVFIKDSGFAGAVTTLAEGATLGLEVSDADINRSATTADTLTVTVTNTTTGEVEQVTLLETGVNTGVFRSTLATSATAGTTNQDGSLQLREGQAIEVTYVDPLFGGTFDNPDRPGVVGDADNDTATGLANKATATVPVPSDTKILYLSDDRTNNLDRLKPSSSDTTAASTALINPATVATAVTISENFAGYTSSSAYSDPDKSTTGWGTNEWSETGDDGRTSGSSTTIRISSDQLYIRGGTNGDYISREFSAALPSAGVMTFDIKDQSSSNAFEDTDKLYVYEKVGATWNSTPIKTITGLDLTTSYASFSVNLSSGATGIRFGDDNGNASSDRVYIDNVKIVAGYVSSGNTSGTTDFPLGSSASAGQTFSFSGSGASADAIRIDSLSLSLKKTGSTAANATVSIRNAWDGAVLWSGTVSTAQLSTSYKDVAVDVSGLTLDKSSTYVLRVDANNSGIVWQGDTSATYAGGTRLNASGDAATGDMRFAVNGREAQLSAVSFSQGLSMASNLDMPQGGVIKVVTHVSSVTGLADGQAITATLSAGGTSLATATNPDYDATAGTLTWTFSPLGANTRILAGQAIKLDIQNNQSGTSFKVDYDSGATPSRIELPTTTVIRIEDADSVTAGVQEIGFFDKAFDNGGAPIAGSVINAGGVVYVRVKVSDPFGDYDISSLTLAIDDGAGGATPLNLSLGDAYVVDAARDGRGVKTYEYAWQTTRNLGSYTVSATAHEGLETGAQAISDTTASSFLVQENDTGSPSTTLFLTNLSSAGGVEAGAVYASGTNRAYLRVTDMDESGSGSVTAVVNGYTVTLAETTTLGVFEADLGLAASHVSNTHSQTSDEAAAYFTNMAAGTTLDASYGDNDDSLDTSADSIGINSAPDATNNSQSIGLDRQATGNVLTDSDGVDTDPNAGQALAVSQVNGNSANLGDTITLPSGARLLVRSDGSYIYDPSTLTNKPATSGSSVSDSFTYTITDGKGGTDTATVNLTITYVNPTAIDNQANTDGAQVEFDVSSKFADVTQNADVIFSATGLPAGLSIDPETGLITGTIGNSASTGGTSGVHTVAIRATELDAEGSPTSTSTNRSFTWTVTNVAPVAVNDVTSTPMGTAVSRNMVTNDSDGSPDSDTLTVNRINGSAFTLNTDINTTNGKVKVTNANGAYTYTPNAGYTGTDSFTYAITDGNGGTSTATVTIHVNGVLVTDNNSTATGQESVVENASLSGKTFTVRAPAGQSKITVAGTDVTAARLDNASSSPVVIATGKGTLTITGYNSDTGVVTYSYDPDGTRQNHSSGDVTDAVSLSVTDVSNATANGTLTVLITDTNPVANADAPSVTEGTSASPAANLQGNVLASGATGDVADTPGADTAVTVTRVIAGNAVPTTAVSANSTRSSNGTSVTGTYGTLVLGADGSYSYDLNDDNVTVDALGAGQSLADVFSYQVTDADGDTSTTTLTVTINGTNDPLPSFAVNDVTVNEDAGTLTFTVTKTDATLQTTSVQYDFAPGTATSGGSGAANDYTATAGSLSFAANETSKTISVTINDDGVFEGSESFNINLSGATGATISDAQGVGTIRDDGLGGDDDGNPNDNANDTARNDDRGIVVAGLDDVSEGSPAVFVVTLPDGNPRDTEIDLSLGHGNGAGDAQASDYTANLAVYYFNGNTRVDLVVTNGRITLPTGVTRFFVSVPTVQDAQYEVAERFSLTAGIVNGNTASDSTAIVDDGSGRVYDERGQATGGLADNDRPVASPPPSVVVVPPAVPAPSVLPPPTPPAGPAQVFASMLTPLAVTLAPVDLSLSMPEGVTSSTGYQIPVRESGSPGLSLFRGVTDQFIQSTDVSTRISLPFDAFIHSNRDAVIKLEAKLSDDSRLPAWVQFDPVSGVFEVTPPPGFKGKIDVKVLARDDDGREVVALFQMFIGEQTQDRLQGRESLSDKLRMASKRVFTAQRLVELPVVPVREAQPVRARAG